MKNVHPHQSQPGFAASAAGFTVLELMIAVAVLAILLGIGVPSFQGIIRQNRLAAQTNELLGAAAMARSEAVKRGTTVTLCPAESDGANICAGDPDWSNGLIVFADDQGTVGTIDAGDVIIQRWPAATPRRMTVTNDDITRLTYRRDGGTTLGTGGTAIFTVAPVDDYCEDPQGAREVTVTGTGRVNADKADCP